VTQTEERASISTRGRELVCAELARRGLTVLPREPGLARGYLRVAGPQGQRISLRVKTVRRGDWQFDVRDFLRVSYDGATGRQRVEGPLPLPEPDLVNVFAFLGESATPRFFILSQQELQEVVRRGYEEFLERHGGVRPHKSDSFHRAVRADEIKQYEGRWSKADAGG
jgi:hypothetical protein